MQKISHWARCHVAAARVLIVFIKITLAVLAYFTGITLYKMQLFFPVVPLFTFAAVLLTGAVLFYPVYGKTKLSKKLFYIRQKTCDFLLPLSAVIIFTTWVNNADTINISTVTYGSHIIKHPTAQEILRSGKTKAGLTKIEKRILKKSFLNS